MKTLLLLRHAKSSRDDINLRDFDRPLNHRGKDDAKQMGRVLQPQQIIPEVVISSPAKRARKTARKFLKHSGLTLEAVFNERIYEASLHDLLQVAAAIEPQHNTALLVGHNPGFEELLACLTGQLMPMPTAALACIDLNIDEWKNVRPQSGKLRWLVTPRDLTTN
jgi:phosphohistidine phosphatase